MRQGTALIVDDEPTIRMLLRALLRECGLGALEAGDGVEALEVLERQGQDVRLVLLDLTMPRMDGRAALGEIAARWPGLPCVAMSGFSEDEMVGQFGGLPLAGCLEKPFTRQSVQELLAKLLKAG